MKKALFILYLLSASFYSYGQEKYPEIEHLSYNGYYNWGFIWIQAGMVHFQVTTSDKYKGAVKLEAVGYSQPNWDWIFRLRDTLISHFNPVTYMPYEFSRKAHEGNYHKIFDYTWDYPNNRILADIHRIGRYVRKDTIALKPSTHDMLSIVWKVRELDYDQYTPGDTIPIKLLIDEEVFDLYVRYHGTEEIKFDRNKRQCYVFSPMLVEGEVFKKGENMKIWLSKDKERLPLMVEAKILVGSVKGILDPSKTKFKNK